MRSETMTNLRSAVLCLSALGAAVLLGASAQPAKAPGFDSWGTGANIRAYNRLSVDCQNFTHRFGRNAAWGLWVMPLDKIKITVRGKAPDAPARLEIKCRGGKPCIGKGALRDIKSQIAEHGIDFDTGLAARAMAASITKTRKACARRR
jgi:hypothetical protein